MKKKEIKKNWTFVDKLYVFLSPNVKFVRLRFLSEVLLSIVEKNTFLATRQNQNEPVPITRFKYSYFLKHFSVRQKIGHIADS